jgi:hypothetical protein
MVRLGRGGEAKGLIVARDLDKKYVRGSEEIHVPQGLNLDSTRGSTWPSWVRAARARPPC